MVRLLRAAIVPLVLVALTALPALVVGRIYSGSLLVELVAGAAAGSVVVSVAARRLPSWSVAPLSVLLLVGYTAAALRITAQRAALDDPLPKLAFDALTNGIPRLLTAMIPVEATPDTVAVPLIATWLAGLAGAEVAMRAGRVLLGCVPAAALFAGALYVVGPNAGAAGWPTLTFAVLVACALAVTARPAGRAALADVPAAARAAVRGRAAAGTVLGVAIVLALIALVGPWVGARVSSTPVDPRRYVQPPQVDTLDESPLNRISGWSLDPAQRLFRVGPEPTPTGAPAAGGPSAGGPPASGPPGSGAPRGGSPSGGSASGGPQGEGAASGKPTGAASSGGPAQRLRLAVLPDYDGVTWRVGATYRNAGRVLPTPPALPGAQVRQVREQITIDGLTGRLLPAVPTPTGVDGARVAYDLSTGTLLRAEGLTPGVHYTVTSALTLPDLNRLPSADVHNGPDTARFLAVALGVPDQVQRLAAQLSADNGAPYDRATAIQDFLAEHYRMVPDSPSGHSYPNLAYFLFGPRDQGGQRGTSEQFAAAFALLARLSGLPTRVVVGFDVPAGGGVVTGGDASAWPEVLFDGLGWVAFDPLPRIDELARPVEEDFTAKPPTPPPASASAPPLSPPPSTPTTPPVVLAVPPARGTPAVVLAGGAFSVLSLVLAAAGFSVVLLRRAQRRRRLTVGAPELRITGAWLEFTDALRLAGRPVPAHLAATEVAAQAAAVPLLRRSTPPDRKPSDRKPTSGPPGHKPTSAEPEKVDKAPEVLRLPRVDDLVHGLNVGTFAPGPTDPKHAERAGRQAVAYADALRAHRSWWRRILWSVHPGPLRWHRRR